MSKLLNQYLCYCSCTRYVNFPSQGSNLHPPASRKASQPSGSERISLGPFNVISVSLQSSLVQLFFSILFSVPPTNVSLVLTPQSSTNFWMPSTGGALLQRSLHLQLMLFLGSPWHVGLPRVCFLWTGGSQSWSHPATASPLQPLDLLGIQILTQGLLSRLSGG